MEPSFLALSAADERVLSFDKASFLGSSCVHRYDQSAMQRADRRAAAASLDVRVLTTADLDEVLGVLRESLLLPAQGSDWRACDRQTLHEKLQRSHSFVVGKPVCVDSGASSLPPHAILLEFEPAAAAHPSAQQQQQPSPLRFACFVPLEVLDSTTTAAALLAFAVHLVGPARAAGGAGPGRLEILTWPYRSAEGRDVDSRLSAALSAANFTRDPGPAMRVFATSAAVHGEDAA
jgi:hypothetical protein